jgi:hypothetical protein
MKEIDEIKERYERRKEMPVRRNWDYNYWVQCEREYWYLNILKKYQEKYSSLKLLEVGAGSGSNLNFFHRIGFKYENLFANELLLERGITLKENVPTPNIYIGDALDLNFSENFDIVFQSTVFTSILDLGFRNNLAFKMWKMTKKDGIILWYDFVYNNPKNTDVKGVKKKEIRQMFPDAASIEFHRVTMAPPIGRRIGIWYNFFNILFPFLRTHVIAVIKK